MLEVVHSRFNPSHLYVSAVFVILCIWFFIRDSDDGYLWKPCVVDYRLEEYHEKWQKCVQEHSKNFGYDAQQYLDKLSDILQTCESSYTILNYSKILNGEIPKTQAVPASYLPDSLYMYYRGNPVADKEGENKCVVESKFLYKGFSDVEYRSIRNAIVRIIIENQFFIYLNNKTSTLYLINVCRSDCVTQYIAQY